LRLGACYNRAVNPRALALLFAIACTGCGIILPIHESDDDASVDGGGDDAASAADAAAGADADGGRVNLLKDPSFELDSILCSDSGGWTPEVAVTSFLSADGGVDGGLACNVCSSQKTGAGQTIEHAYPAGTQFHASVQVAVAPPATSGSAQLLVVFQEGGGLQEYIKPIPTPITSTFLTLQGSWTVVRPVQTIAFYVEVTEPGSCILADDAWFWTQ
jgi:hypothetical protein